MPFNYSRFKKSVKAVAQCLVNISVRSADCLMTQIKASFIAMGVVYAGIYKCHSLLYIISISPSPSVYQHQSNIVVWVYKQVEWENV